GARKGRGGGILKFKIRLLRIGAGGKPIAILGEEDAKALGTHPLDRIEIHKGRSHVISIVNVAKAFPQGFLGIYDEVLRNFDLGEGEVVEVRSAEDPVSLTYIREKILGAHLNKAQIHSIVKDISGNHLSDIELAAFVTGLQINGISLDEAEGLSRAMLKSGRTLRIDRRPILDKHSIGGVPGDKTTMLVVPIIAAAGFTIPKTSSRSITSPAGTADRVEVLCRVDLSREEILRVVEKTNACMVWGGALDLAPVDDQLIKIEHPLSIDPLLLPSIMSKKKAVGAQFVVLDIPTGRGAKIKTVGEAEILARDFIELGKRLDIRVECAVTYGEQPIGRAVGPALEAKEALMTIMGNGPSDLLSKAEHLAGILFEMVGKGGKAEAAHLIKSGKAEKKLRELIEAQGGNPEIRPDEIEIGDKVYDHKSTKDGHVLWIDNGAIARIAREAGAPRDKGAGIFMGAKLGDRVRKNAVLLKIYAESSQKLESAVALVEGLNPILVSERLDGAMLIDRIPAAPQRREAFPLER
ncbi:MAG TPA: AMP phosphorylase, partial [Candidatus Bathyarchaeia archaeon]|nr:AMP phosphorylase [Candidatus Bathyarchaeia archaeon]